MLDAVRARLERGPARLNGAGTAEDTGLDLASADLVTAAQAFHWFDKDRALVRRHAILKPSGGLALFWNVRDAERSPFLAEYADLLRRSTEHGRSGRRALRERRQGRDAPGARGPCRRFDAPQLTQLRHEVTMTDDEFIGMAFTASYVRVGKSPEEQDRFRLELAALLGRHGLNDGRPFPVPYRLDLWTARRKDR